VKSLCASLLCLLLVAAPVHPADPDAASNQAVDAAIGRGLAYLARLQNTDGSFDGGGRRPDGSPDQPGPRMAMTGLSLIAFLSAGHTPDLGRYGLNTRAALDYLLEEFPEDGYAGRADGSRMYGQAIVTLALAQVHGVEGDAAQRQGVRAAIDKAVRIILQAQQAKKNPGHEGGWRYDLQSADSDLSVTAWCIAALRAARDAGVEVPDSALEAACAYVLRCQHARDNGFAYQPNGSASATMTAAALLCIPQDSPQARSATEYLAGALPRDQPRFPYYAAYYAAHTAQRVGGELWTRTWADTVARLLPMQQRDGGWPASSNSQEPGRVYATAMAVLTLSVPSGVLPMQQSSPTPHADRP